MAASIRQFDFLKSASVTAGASHDGVVDIAVITQDVWTTDVNGDFSNEGGIAAYDFDVTQKDLFGTGTELELHLDHGVERRANTLEFLSPAVPGTMRLDTPDHAALMLQGGARFRVDHRLSIISDVRYGPAPSTIEVFSLRQPREGMQANYHPLLVSTGLAIRF